MSAFTLVSTKAKVHLTKADRDLIKFSIANKMSECSSQFKRLFNIVRIGDDNHYKADLYSYEEGIGIGAARRWIKREIEFKVKVK